MIRAVEVLKPGEAIKAAPFHLKRTIAEGEPPRSIRVSSPELVAALAPAFRAVAIHCAATPEIDALLESLAEFESRKAGEAIPTYFDCGVEERAIASFFRAAKRFYESAPSGAWEEPCTVSILELDIENAAVSIMGDMGQHYGFILFASMDDLDRFGMGAIDLEEGNEPSVPRHTALEFEPRKAMPASMVAEIKLHGWKIAGSKAYPFVHVVDSIASRAGRRRASSPFWKRCVSRLRTRSNASRPTPTRIASRRALARSRWIYASKQTNRSRKKRPRNASTRRSSDSPRRGKQKGSAAFDGRRGSATVSTRSAASPRMR